MRNSFTPGRFPDADRFDVARRIDRHLSFGYGAHFCVGAALARMETQVALTSLVRRAPGLALAVDEVAYKSNVVLRGMESLPVALRG